MSGRLRSVRPVIRGGRTRIPGARRSTTAVAVAAAAAITLGGCTVDGSATRSPVDYDTGKYKTVPESSDIASAQWRAGARLGEHVPFRGEIDPGIVRATMGIGPMSSPRNLDSILVDAESIPENREFRFGFLNPGNDSDPDTSTSPTRSLRMAILRYTDAAAVEAVIGQAADRLLAAWKANRAAADTLPPLRVAQVGTLDGLPRGAVVVRGDGDGDGDDANSLALVPHGMDLLISSTAGYPLADADRMHRRVVERLVAGSDASRDIEPEETDRLDEVYRLAVPFADRDSRYSLQGTVVGAHTAAHLFHDSRQFGDLLAAAGVDAVATRETTLYRAADAGKARMLRGEFERRYGSGTARRAPAPRDLPTAPCFRSPPSDGGVEKFTCLVAHDRYFAVAQGADSLDVRRKISAQYVLLERNA